MKKKTLVGYDKIVWSSGRNLRKERTFLGRLGGRGYWNRWWGVVSGKFGDSIAS